jgi:hypothetical protein
LRVFFGCDLTSLDITTERPTSSQDIADSGVNVFALLQKGFIVYRKWIIITSSATMLSKYHAKSFQSKCNYLLPWHYSYRRREKAGIKLSRIVNAKDADTLGIWRLTLSRGSCQSQNYILRTSSRTRSSRSKSIRDDDMCHEKYGNDWIEYKRQVPYRFLPGIV